MKIIHKLSIRLILLQVLAIQLFGIAFSRLYYFLNADLCECVLKSLENKNHTCWNTFANFKIGDLIAGPIYYMLYGLLFGIVLVSIVNGIRKKAVLNTILVAVLFIILFLIGAFSSRYSDSWIFSLGRLFSDKVAISNVIAALIAFLAALGLVWFSVKSNADKNR